MNRITHKNFWYFTSAQTTDPDLHLELEPTRNHLNYILAEAKVMLETAGLGGLDKELAKTMNESYIISIVNSLQRLEADDRCPRKSAPEMSFDEQHLRGGRGPLQSPRAPDRILHRE